MELASLHKTPTCEYDAYRKIIGCADMLLAAYDPAKARGNARRIETEVFRSRGRISPLFLSNQRQLLLPRQALVRRRCHIAIALHDAGVT